MAESQVIFITGVGRGIGRALAQLYLSRPNHIVIGSVRDEKSPELASIQSFKTAQNTKLLLVHIESTSLSDPQRAVNEIKAAGVDHIDVVIANAGGYPPVLPLDTVGREDLMSCFEINAAAPLFLFQTIQDLLRPAKSPKWAVISTSAGSIGQIGVIGSHFLPAYGASKAALNWLTQALHFTQSWLTVVALHPGLVQTAQGNWVANYVGLEQAPTTTEDSASGIVKVLDGATRENTSGKFIDAVEGTEVPWPDLAMVLRYQIPLLVSLGLQVVVPDQLGYGRITAPDLPTEYSLQKISTRMVLLVHEVTDKPVFVGGHEWGAILAWRFALYHPALVRAIFCFSIPFLPPETEPLLLEEFAKRNPMYQYQAQIASPEVETLTNKTPKHLRCYLNAMFGGATPDGLPGFDPSVGILTDRLLRIGPSPLVTDELMDYYVKEFSRNGCHGPMNRYRTRSSNAEDEQPIAQQSSQIKFQIPATLVMADQDPVFTPDLARDQEQYFLAGLKSEVISDFSHWILIHFPEQSNLYIREFIDSVLGNATAT